MGKLTPQEPEKVMVIRDVVPNTIATFSIPFARFGLINVGGRGTVVRLRSGALAVFSPVALTDAVKAKVASMGEVKYITAPDMEHHIYLGPWKTAYPDAKVIGPEGLPEKRTKQKTEAVPFSYIFSSQKPITIDPEFDAEFEYEFVHGHINKEIVFHHRPTRTMIEADLIFNLPAVEQYSKSGINSRSGLLTKLFSSINSIKGNSQKRIIWYGTSSGDRTSFNASMARINQWDFDRIIPCHGDVMESNAKGIFQTIMQWHLEAAKKSS